MFKTIVSGTQFTSSGANEFFGSRIDGMEYSGDVSFISTLRALLGPRIGEDGRVYLQFSSASSSRVFSADQRDVHNYIEPQGGFHGVRDQISVVNLTASLLSEDKRNTVMEKVSKALREVEGYVEYPEITVFYKKSFNVLCFINHELRNVIVYVDAMDIRKLHYLQVSTLAMFPWFFNKESVTEDEIALIKSLRETSEANYLDALNKLANSYDFRSLSIRKLLCGFEQQYDRVQLEGLQLKLNNCERKVQDYLEKIGMFLRDKENIQINIMGLEKKMASGSSDSELMEYFISNKKLVLDTVMDSTVYFTVIDHIQYFDREAAELVIHNLRGSFYNRSSARIPNDKLQKLLEEIFLADKPRLRIKTCAQYSVDLANREIIGRSGASYGPECSDCIPNMHIERHSCLGDYAQIFAELLTENNYIGIIEQCIASAKSLNFYDGTVIGEFADAFVTGSRYNNRCIELPDGTVVKPADAIRWLDDQEAGEDGQEE